MLKTLFTKKTGFVLPISAPPANLQINGAHNFNVFFSAVLTGSHKNRSSPSWFKRDKTCNDEYLGSPFLVLPFLIHREFVIFSAKIRNNDLKFPWFKCRHPFIQPAYYAVALSRPNILQLWSLKTRRKTFLNYKMCANPWTLRVQNCDITRSSSVAICFTDLHCIAIPMHWIMCINSSVGRRARHPRTDRQTDKTQVRSFLCAINLYYFYIILFPLAHHPAQAGFRRKAKHFMDPIYYSCSISN